MIFAWCGLYRCREEMLLALVELHWRNSYHGDRDLREKHRDPALVSVSLAFAVGKISNPTSL